MRTATLLAIATTCFLPTLSSAQQWSKEQQEVWDFELSCQQSKAAWIDCFHSDYIGWNDMGLGTPVTKADVSALGAYWWDCHDRLVVHMKPVSITVRGDFAVVLLIYTAKVRDRDSGEVTTESSAWTDVLVKEGGRWYWFADHGAVLGTN